MAAAFHDHGNLVSHRTAPHNGLWGSQCCKEATTRRLILLFGDAISKTTNPVGSATRKPTKRLSNFWEPDSPTKQNELVPTAIHIECNRHGGREANLVHTEAFCVVATAMISPIGSLMADFSWQAASWDDDEITISDDSSICLINKTFFDLKRKTVTGLDIRKPEAKGFAD